MTPRTIQKISKLLIKKAALHVYRTVAVLNQEFDIEINGRIAEKCLAESIAMEWFIIDTLFPDQYKGEKTAIVNSILDATQACLLRGWKTNPIGEWFDEYLKGALSTYPVPELIFSPNYYSLDYVSNDNPPQNSIINHFMERIADLIDVPETISPETLGLTDRGGMDRESPQLTLATIKAVVGWLADNHIKHLLITNPLKKLLTPC